MEKLVVFGPIILFFLFFAALVIGFLTVVLRLIFKAKASAWRGTITNKVFNERRDFDDDHKMNQFYSIEVQTDDGKKSKMGLSKQMYDSFTVGDHLEKKAGELWPKKVD
jgi:hypothetical protein